MNWQPMFDKLLVRRRDPEKERGGIAIPEGSEKPQRIGVVVAAGPGRLCLETGSLVSLTVEVGDEVMFGHFSGVELPELDPLLVLLREDEVLMVSKQSQAVAVEPQAA
jgi:chaperonin GroES